MNNRIKSLAIVALISSVLVSNNSYAQFRSNTATSTRSTYSGSFSTISNPVIIRAGGITTPGTRSVTNSNSVIIRNSNQNFNRFGR